MTEKRGRGVFAKKDIADGELIETCQLLIFSLPDADIIEDTKSFTNYWFLWDYDDDNRFAAFCLGSGSLYNHSSDPNAKIEKDYPNETISYRAIKNIPAGTEITFKYGTVWFEEK